MSLVSFDRAVNRRGYLMDVGSALTLGVSWAEFSVGLHLRHGITVELGFVFVTFWGRT